MNNKAFGEVIFDCGFVAETKAELTLWGKSYSISICVKAFFEKDGITQDQENAYLAYKLEEREKRASIENMLKHFQEAQTGEPATAISLRAQFSPRTLLFARNGEYALLVDDAADPDGGVAICLSPVEKLVPQDDYL